MEGEDVRAQFEQMIKIPLLMHRPTLLQPSYILAQSSPQRLSGMGFLMRGMRGQLGAHDERDAEGMHFLNNVMDVVVFNHHEN